MENNERKNLEAPEMTDLIKKCSYGGCGHGQPGLKSLSKDSEKPDYVKPEVEDLVKGGAGCSDGGCSTGKR